jgi:GNAT superfamily N-acetyltransferase
MDLTWLIRAATPKDSDRLGKCMQMAYAVYHERMDGIRLPPMDVDYAAEIQSYPAWIVESDKNVIGGLIMVFDKFKASIANIAVDPGYQGYGIGRALLEFAESKAHENDCSELHLTTHVLLHENISLYQHLGWEEIASTSTKIFMRKKICINTKKN